MDDPLKQKAVPLAAETVLWFEFLLHPNLITKHLSKSNPDPNAMELMAQFINLAPDTPLVPQYELPAVDENALPVAQQPPIAPPVDRLNIPRKSLALKTLALKVCTFLKWNLDALEKSLNIRKQMALLRDLCTISFGKLISVPLAPDFQSTISPDGHEHAVRFALTFYHRWVLRLQIIRSSELSRNGAARAPNGNVMVLAEPGQPPLPEISPQTSVGYLQELCQSQDPFYIFTFDTFVLPQAHAEETKQNFEDMKPISPSELRAQIYFDLVNYYLFSKQYELAREAVCACRENYNACKAEYAARKQTPADFLYTHLKDDELEGYLMACGVSNKEVTLLERFNQAQFSQYKDIVEILKQDNRERIIPFVNRRVIELDIEACISQELLPEEARRLAVQVGALNVVRSVFDQRNICHTTDFFSKYHNSKCVPEFIDAVTDVLPHLGDNEKSELKAYIVDCILTESNGERGNILQQAASLNLFTTDEINDMKAQITEEELPNLPLAVMTEWKFQSKCKLKNARNQLKLNQLELENKFNS